MDHRSPECTHKKIGKMLPARVLVGGGGRRKRTEVLSGMIVWNVLVLVLLVLALCVQGQGGAVPSNTSPQLVQKRLAGGASVKRADGDNSGPTNPAENTTLLPQSSQGNESREVQDSQAIPKSSDESENKGEGEGGGDAQPIPDNKPGTTNSTTKEESGNGSVPSHLPSMSTEAVLRGFYVFVSIGAIMLIYIVIKLARLRKRRAPGKYRVLSHSDDQETFPLAAGEGEDEEIFNAAHHLPLK